MTGFGVSNMDYTPVKFIIKCFEANYPESLGVVLVHKAPWIFQGFWKIIRGWLDPVVAGKISFTDSLEDLQKFIDIDKIPKKLGGNEDWEYSYIEPDGDENARMKDVDNRAHALRAHQELIVEYEAKTRDWLGADASSDEATSLRDERARLAKRLRSSYWDVDPYIRARSLYDRNGVIEDNGDIHFYPGSEPDDEWFDALEYLDLEDKGGASAGANGKA